MDSVKKMFWVIFKPNKIFNELKDRPVFMAPLILIVLSMLLLSSLFVFSTSSIEKAMDKQFSKQQDTGEEDMDDEYVKDGERVKDELWLLKEDGASPEELRVEEKILRGQVLTATDKKAMRKYLKNRLPASEIEEQIEDHQKSIIQDKKWEDEIKRLDEENKASQKDIHKRIKNIKNNLPESYGFQIFYTVLSLLFSALSFFVVGIILGRRKSYSRALSFVTVSHGPVIITLVLYVVVYVVSFAQYLEFSLNPLIGLIVLSLLMLAATLMVAIAAWSIVVYLIGFAVMYDTPYLRSFLIVLLVLVINMVVFNPLSYLYGF